MKSGDLLAYRRGELTTNFNRAWGHDGEDPRVRRRGVNSTLRFGPFELGVAGGGATQKRLRIRLQEQPLQILLILLERQGQVVLREEIQKRIWPGNTVVEFDHSINAAVKRLRDALRDSAERPRYIETIAKRGYRFIAKVDGTVRPTSLAEPEPPERENGLRRPGKAPAARLRPAIVP